MASKPLADNGSDMSVLVTLARLKEARWTSLVTADERDELISRLQEPYAKAVAQYLLTEQNGLESEESRQMLEAVNRLAGVE
jgi:hypothetical protein